MSDTNSDRPYERRSTMQDVAKRAGVGVKTVSRVLGGKSNVAPATASRVLAAVRELDYRKALQHVPAREGDGEFKILGLLIGSADNPFSGAVQRGIEDTALRRQAQVLTSSFNDNPSRESGAIRRLLQRHVNGLILTTSTTDPDYITELRERGVPVAFVDRRPVGVDFDSVSSDNRAGAARATAHLIQHGHRRIALLADRPDLATAAERRVGFLEAIRSAGVPIADVSIRMGLRDADAARLAMSQLLASRLPPTAVFSAQNSITIGALHALRAARVERSVAIIGFDDVPLADLVDPGITVVAQNPFEMGRAAAERVFLRLDGDISEAVHVVVPTALIPRGSGEIRGPYWLNTT